MRTGYETGFGCYYDFVERAADWTPVFTGGPDYLENAQFVAWQRVAYDDPFGVPPATTYQILHFHTHGNNPGDEVDVSFEDCWAICYAPHGIHPIHLIGFVGKAGEGRLLALQPTFGTPGEDRVRFDVAGELLERCQRNAHLVVDDTAAARLAIPGMIQTCLLRYSLQQGNSVSLSSVSELSRFRFSTSLPAESMY